MLVAVIPLVLGIYQIGEDQALSCIVEGISDLGLLPDFIASQVDHLQVGFSKTLT